MASVATAQAEPNLWQTLLGQAMRAKRDSDGTLLVVGDAGSGKRALVQCLRECVPDELLRDTRMPARATSQIAVWSVATSGFTPTTRTQMLTRHLHATCGRYRRPAGLFPGLRLDGALAVVAMKELSRTVVMIVLDFERPSGMIASPRVGSRQSRGNWPCMQQYASQDKWFSRFATVRLYRVKMRSGSSSTSTSVATERFRCQNGRRSRQRRRRLLHT